jgi:hypothetical protein
MLACRCDHRAYRTTDRAAARSPIDHAAHDRRVRAASGPAWAARLPSSDRERHRPKRSQTGWPSETKALTSEHALVSSIRLEPPSAFKRTEV